MWLTARSGPGRLSLLPDPLEGLETSRLHFNAGVLVRGVQNQMDSLLFHQQQSNSSIQSAENSLCAGCCAAGVPGALIKLGNPLQMLFYEVAMIFSLSQFVTKKQHVWLHLIIFLPTTTTTTTSLPCRKVRYEEPSSLNMVGLLCKDDDLLTPFSRKWPTEWLYL